MYPLREISYKMLQSYIKIKPGKMFSYISPDLTLKECEINRKLKEELWSHKSVGEKDLYTKRGKIVIDPKRSTQTQSQSIWLDNSPPTAWLKSTHNVNNKSNYPLKTLVMNCYSIVGKKAILDNYIACYRPEIIVGAAA